MPQMFCPRLRRVKSSVQLCQFKWGKMAKAAEIQLVIVCSLFLSKVPELSPPSPNPFFLMFRLRPGFRTGGWNWRGRYRSTSTVSCLLLPSTAIPWGLHQLSFTMVSATPLLHSTRDSCLLPRCLLCHSASPFPDMMHHKAPTTLWQMRCYTTISIFFLILLSIQLFKTKRRGNAILCIRYSENKKEQAKGNSVICYNVFCP